MLADYKNMCMWPHACGGARIVTSGRAEVVTVRTSALIKFLASSAGLEHPRLTDVHAFLAALAGHQLTAMLEDQVPINSCVLEAGALLWIPTGWIAAEMSVRGVLVYGIRRAVLTRTVEGLANYEELLGAHKASKTYHEKMGEMADLLQPEEV